MRVDRAVVCPKHTMNGECKMRKKVKRILALLLAIGLAVSVMSGMALSASSEEGADPASSATEEVVQEEPVDTTLEEPADEPAAEEEEQEEQDVPEEADPEPAAEEEEQVDAEEATDDVEPIEEEEEEVENYLNTLSAEELYNYLIQLDDEDFDAAWATLSSSQKQAYNAYALQMAFGNNPETEYTEGGGAAVSMTNAGPLVESDSTDTADDAEATPAVFSAALRSVARSAGTVLVTEPVKVSDGLYMSKTISKDNSDEKDTNYTITLESYSTGKVTGGESKPKPCDIVLVLDQSGSMSNSFNKVTLTETAFAETATNSFAYDNDNKDYLYVKTTDGEHIKVTITRTTVSETYVGTTQTNSQWYRQRNSLNGEYYYKDGDSYYQVTNIRRTGNYDDRKYTYICDDRRYTPLNDGASGSTTLYQVTKVYSYTYSYTDMAGQEHTVTIEGNDSKIPSASNHSEFFADGIEKQLYYSERETVTDYTRRDALVEAVNQFVGSVEQDAANKDVDHRIAIAGFSSSGYNNTEILTGVTISNKNGVQYDNNSTGYTDATKTALQSARTVEGKASISNAVNALTAKGGTQTQDGMAMATDIFANQDEQYKAEYEAGTRNKVIILFTDGRPGDYSFDTSVANSAISKAQALKDEGATVYSIGIFDGADPKEYTYTDNATESVKSNCFMNYVSSNYPDAESLTNPGTKEKSDYYLTATNSTGLNEIFKAIYTSIEESSSSVNLDATTEVIDQMSEYFQLPENVTAANIEAYKVPYTGKDTSGNYTFNADKNTWESIDQSNITIDTATNRVTVTGFSYKDDYIATVNATPQGYKLVIKIPVVYNNAACFGGNNIPSNDVGSGIYNNGNCAGTFAEPEVNRVIDYSISAQDQTIYVTNSADLEDLLAYATGYEPDGVNNAFVDITYTLKKDDTEIATYVISAGQDKDEGTWRTADGQTLNPADLEDCTEYTFTCSVAPTKDGTDALGTDGSDNKPAVQLDLNGNKAVKGTVHVLYPTVTANDTFICWGEEIDLSTLCGQSDEWKDRNGDTSIPAVTGTAPTVTVTPGLVAGDTVTDSTKYAPAKDSDFALTVNVGRKDVTSVVRTLNGVTTNKKDHDNCDNTSLVDSDTSYDFRVHVKVKTVTVKKIVDGNMGDTSKSFNFTYTIGGVSGEPFSLTNQGTHTVKVPVNKVFEVTETTTGDGYSTTYKVDNGQETEGTTCSLTLTKDDTNKTVTFTNKKTVIPPSGVNHNVIPYIIMVVLAAGAGVYFVMRRRPRGRHSR